MRILQLHCDSIEYTPTKKEIKSAEEITPETKRIEEYGPPTYDGISWSRADPIIKYIPTNNAYKAYHLLISILPK